LKQLRFQNLRFTFNAKLSLTTEEVFKGFLIGAAVKLKSEKFSLESNSRNSDRFINFEILVKVLTFEASAETELRDLRELLY